MRVADVLTRNYLCIRGATLLRPDDPNPCGIFMIVVDEEHRPVGTITPSSGPRVDARIPAGVWHPSMLGGPRSGVRADTMMDVGVVAVSDQDSVAAVARAVLAAGAPDAVACDSDGRVVGVIGRNELAAARTRGARARAIEPWSTQHAT